MIARHQMLEKLQREKLELECLEGKCSAIVKLLSDPLDQLGSADPPQVIPNTATTPLPPPVCDISRVKLG